MSARDDIIQLAFNQGRADKELSIKNGSTWSGHKIASEKYPTDDECFEAYMQGWDAVVESSHWARYG